MVKFAKYIPLLEEAEDAMQQALYIVDESVEYHRVPVASSASQYENASSTLQSYHPQ
jgi:hypothetical protein